MGHPKCLDVFREKHIGIGFRWQRLHPGWLFSLSLPFYTIVLDTGAGK